ncbi:hypothetical protein [Salarchaeum sp. JOR-1]|uniref:hypothetical protein n=1 Tax=Salarchaeum sp. JOR-1 TaxID=2599399 RepID=UPI00197F306A|nr:hypothetical protein [Salarchaeum sp. JOR-1]
MTSLTSGLVLFVVSLLVGGFGLYVGGRVVAGVDDYSHAVVTALVGAVVWAITATFLGWIPLLGPVLVFLTYLWVVKHRYPGGWVNAALITLVAWLTLVVVLAFAESVGTFEKEFDAFGVPGI